LIRKKRACLMIIVFCFGAFSGTIWAGQVSGNKNSSLPPAFPFHIQPFSAGSNLEDHALGSNSQGSKIGNRKLYLLNLSAGIAAYLQGHHDLTGTPGLGLALSYINGPHFFGVRWASAAFIDGGGYDFSLLYGRAWLVRSFLFSIASGLGYSTWDTPWEYYSRIGLPVDIKALVLSTQKGGVSLGIHGFAFIASTYQYFGVCLNLGIFVSGR
jgi:hypothetical protein